MPAPKPEPEPAPVSGPSPEPAPQPKPYMSMPQPFGSHLPFFEFEAQQAPAAFWEPAPEMWSSHPTPAAELALVNEFFTTFVHHEPHSEEFPVKLPTDASSSAAGPSASRASLPGFDQQQISLLGVDREGMFGTGAFDGKVVGFNGLI